MRRRTITLICLGTLPVLTGGLLGPARPARSAQEPKAQEIARPEPLPPLSPPDEPSPAEGSLDQFLFNTDEAILFFAARVTKDPDDYLSYRHLGEFYERKALETGDQACYAKAEEALRRSDELFPGEPRTRASLAMVLCARHKFIEALTIVEKLVEQDPKDIDALATMGDAYLETGRYSEAEATYQDLHRLAPYPQVLARLANLAELKGDVDEALSLMGRAAEEARRTGKPRADAWYLCRLGDISFSTGQIDEAARYYESVPEGVDAYHDATAGLGRVLAAQGHLDEAISQYEEAIAIGPDPHMLAALGDLHALRGEADRAAELHGQLVRETEGDPEAYRELALFLADHGRDTARAVEVARLDLEQRQDIFAHDALAWALHKNGQDEEAAEAIEAALALGTRDARLHFHAGMIRHALGDAAKAREHLEAAMEINPAFSPRDAKLAAETLASLP